MTDIGTRGSVVAIKEETTEGTPVSPTAAGDYIARQDDFQLNPSFNSLANAELRSSIGAAEPITGLEVPTGSFSHYLRSSGTGGTAPNYGLLMEAAWGNEDDAGVEHDTVSSSTTTVINVDTGEGATYLRGQPLLIKDLTNGYSIAVVHSISSDALTIGFPIDNAPASGINLGEAITYYPAQSGHPTFSIWHYVDNGGAIEMAAGNRVTAFSLSASAGELINISYSLEGVKSYYNPLEVTSSNQYIDYNEGGGSSAVTITNKIYRDPDELAAEIQAKLDADATATITCTYSDTTGKFTIASDGGTFELEWNTGTNAANTIGALLGYSTAADDTGATSYASDNAITLSSPQTPTYDDASPIAAKNMRVMLGDGTDNTCVDVSEISIDLTNTKVNKESICAETGVTGSLFSERLIEVTLTGLAKQYEVDRWRRFRQNEDVRFQFNFGEKDTAGNWLAGACGAFYLPTGRISSLTPISDADGLAVFEATIQAYVNSDGEIEAALGFL